MPPFLARLKLARYSTPSQPPPQSHVDNARSTPQLASPNEDSLSFTPPVERKIHPNLDSLVADYVPPPRRASTDVIHAVTSDLETHPLPLPEFVGLKPGPPRRSHHQSREKLLMAPTDSTSPNLPHVTPSASSQTAASGDDAAPNRTRRLLARLANLSQGSATSSFRSSKVVLSSRGEWSTFGRGRKDEPRPSPSAFSNPDTSGETHQVGSRATSISRQTGTETRSHTPTSTTRSPHYTTPRSHSHSSKAHSGTTSPHTFGHPTPPSPHFTFGAHHHSSVQPLSENPPPLPPLDHPAFRPKRGRKTSASEIFQPFSSTAEDPVETRHPRLSSSLPSLNHSRSGTTRSSASSRQTQSLRQRRARAKARSVSSKTGSISRITAMDVFSASSSANFRFDQGEISGKHSRAISGSSSKHSRTRSRSSSKMSSRRSSAEFSAIQASSVGLNGEDGGSWEAKVSRQIVQLSLGELGRDSLNVVGPELEAGSSRGSMMLGTTGEARGQNSPKEQDQTISNQPLGSPFLLQDTSNNPRTLYHHNNPPDSPIPTPATKDAGERDEITIMSHDELSQTNTRKGKARATPASMSRLGGKGKARGTARNVSSPIPQLASIPDLGPIPGSSSLLMPPSLSFTAPTPEASPISQHGRHQSEPPRFPLSSVLKVASPPQIQKTSSGGKRKVDEVEDTATPGGTPPKEQPRATFANDPRPHRISNSSHAPSSYHRKRPKLAPTSESSRPGSSSSNTNTNAGNTGSWSSRTSHKGPQSSSSNPHLPQSSSSQTHHGYRAPSRKSLSQVSIPISALVSPHAPSLSKSSTFHMRDPRKPAPIQSTGWGLSFPSMESGKRWSLEGWVGRGGSPLPAWAFFVGFVIFPLWWIASFLPVSQTRTLEAGHAEKGVILDDPQNEYDERTWRARCRVMSGVSLLTYIPFIVLIAIFAR